MRADFERRGGARRNGAVVDERRLHQQIERAKRRAGGDRVGRVGDHQHGRIVAAADGALEIRRNFHGEQHLPRGQQFIDFGFAVRQLGDREIFGILNRGENRAAEVALLLQQHSSRQMARIGVDGVAEQHELDERDHDDHGKGHAVALELDEFLHQHRRGLAQEAGTADAARRHVGSMCVTGNCP